MNKLEKYINKLKYGGAGKFKPGDKFIYENQVGTVVRVATYDDGDWGNDVDNHYIVNFDYFITNFHHFILRTSSNL